MHLRPEARREKTTMKKSRRTLHAHCRTGAITVEFALVAPIVLALFLGSVEITRLNFLRHTASNAAYEGARASILPGSNDDDGIAEAIELLNSVGAGNGAVVNLVSTPESVQVTVTIPVAQNSWGLGRFTHNLNLVQSCTLRREMIQ